MNRILLPAVAVTIIAITSPTALYAQRGGRGGRSGGLRESARGAAHVAHPPAAPTTPVPGVDHPLPYDFNAVKPAPVPGRDPIPAPFSVPPDYYNRQHPLASVPYGAYVYGGYAEPDYGATSAPPTPPPADVIGHPQADVPPVAAAPVVVPPVPPAPHPPQTMYVIPGCYGGNVPPIRAKLPPGCEITKVRVLRPPQ